MPAREMTATSVVPPPPISTTMLEVGSVMGRSAPMAAAIGSSIRKTSRAPAHSPLFHLGDAGGHADDNAGADQPAAVVDLGNEVPKHCFRHFKIRDDAILHGTDGHDIARCTAKHPLGFAAHGQHLVVAAIVAFDRDHGRFPQNDTLALDVDAGVGGSKIDCQIVRKESQNLIQNP